MQLGKKIKGLDSWKEIIIFPPVCPPSAVRTNGATDRIIYLCGEDRLQKKRRGWTVPCDVAEFVLVKGQRAKCAVCSGERAGSCQEQLEHADRVTAIRGHGAFCLLWECRRGMRAFCWVSAVRAPSVNRARALGERTGLFAPGWGCLSQASNLCGLCGVL